MYQPTNQSNGLEDDPIAIDSDPESLSPSTKKSKRHCSPEIIRSDSKSENFIPTVRSRRSPRKSLGTWKPIVIPSGDRYNFEETEITPVDIYDIDIDIEKIENSEDMDKPDVETDDFDKTFGYEYDEANLVVLNLFVKLDKHSKAKCHKMRMYLIKALKPMKFGKFAQDFQEDRLNVDEQLEESYHGICSICGKGEVKPHLLTWQVVNDDGEIGDAGGICVKQLELLRRLINLKGDDPEELSAISHKFLELNAWGKQLARYRN